MRLRKIQNTIQSALDFYKLGQRINRRAKNWAKAYRQYRAGKTPSPPLPSVVQIIPTEHCNLRCKMCNQWGDTGYFVEGLRKPSHMPFDDLARFLDKFKALKPDFTLSLHGGEPLAYKDIGRLLDYLAKNEIDSFFSTNGTLIGRYANELALINQRTFYLLSIDGDRDANDHIRGAGTFDKIVLGVERLREHCERQGTGSPKFILNYCLSEHNSDTTQAIDAIIPVARRLGALFVNYNLRWYLPEQKGLEYDRLLRTEFNVEPSKAWTGWVTRDQFLGIGKAIDRVFYKKARSFLSPLPPWITMIPNGLSRAQAKLFYSNYEETFGISSCIMPSYWIRVHSNGDLIYCPGHPDIIPGNVFKDDFTQVYLNDTSTKLRKMVESRLLPICNRCCGLYMTYPATRYL